MICPSLHGIRSLLPTFYLFVFTVTNFAPLAAQFMSPPPASPSSKLLMPAPHTTLPHVGCNPMLAQYIAAMYPPSQVCALLSTTAYDCTPMLVQYIASIAPGRICAMLPTTATDHPASGASPSSLASDSSQSNKLKSYISFWDRLTVAFLLGAMFLIATVKPRVDAAAKAEDRAASKDDKVYEAVLDELCKDHRYAARAQAEVHEATRCTFPASHALRPDVARRMRTRDDAVKAREEACKKVDDLRAVVGVARMGKVERFMVRCFFVLSILFSLSAGICSAAAFFRSAQLEKGGSMSLAAVIGTIAVAGVPMVLAHAHFLYVALYEN
uniref:Uncharacterized protein n=2 Tax=Aegilops tauschii TaxID=37682 RepID=A0A453AMB8_AEGTS